MIILNTAHHRCTGSEIIAAASNSVVNKEEANRGRHYGRAFRSFCPPACTGVDFYTRTNCKALRRTHYVIGKNDIKRTIPVPIFFRSPELKLNELSCSPGVRLSVRLSVCKFFTYSSSRPEPQRKTIILGFKRIQVRSNEGTRPFTRWDNYEIPNENTLIQFKRSPEPLDEFQPTLDKASWNECDLRFYKKGPFNFQKEDHRFFVPNQCYDIKKLFSNVYWFKLISQVSNVALGSLVIMILIRLNISQIVCLVLYVWKINLGKTACTIPPALSLWNRKIITTNSLQRFLKILYIRWNTRYGRLQLPKQF